MIISLEAAWQRVADRVSPLPVETLHIDDACGRVLAEDLSAGIDLPPFDNSAMDGYALRAVDTGDATDDHPVWLEVRGEIAAGDRPDPQAAPGVAVRIMTGAALPTTADSVLQLEHGRLREGRVEVRRPVPAGRHVRRAGEDVRAGETLMRAGAVLTPQRLGLLASAGIARVRVHRAARVSIVATGSELVAAGEPLGPGMIHDSNRIVLRGLLADTGCELTDLGVAPDDPQRIEECVRAGLGGDVLLLSGGVSVGRHDHVKDVLKGMGAEVVFWRVKLKPGKPLLCARIDDTWVFGLPGNPISAVAGFATFIEPLLRALHGERDVAGPRWQRARLGASAGKRDERALLMTARFEETPEGARIATPTSSQGSAMMRALADADGFVLLPEGPCELGEGDVVRALAL